jgi:hypothetical protein
MSDGDVWGELDRLYFERPRHPQPSTDDLPADPDLDALPPELRDARSLTITGVDEHRNVYDAPITREQAAAAIADARRLREQDFRQDLG